MGISLNTYKEQALQRLIKEAMNEIFDSAPFKADFNIERSQEGYSTERFEDPAGNTIRIIFHSISGEYFELDFTFNGSSFGRFETNYSIKQYSQLLKTVAAAVSQFLKEVRPKAIKFEGVEAFKKIALRTSKEGQKSRVYDQFITQLKNDTEYSIDRQEDGAFNLIKKPIKQYEQ
jgi:hypothetical protein